LANSQTDSKEQWRKRYETYGRDYYQRNKEKILARGRKNYTANGEKYRKSGRDRYNSLTFYPQVIIERCKLRARKQGRPFNITRDDIVIPDVCPVLKIPLQRSYEGKAKANSPSVDCIIPELGYVRNNIQVISYKANVMKNNASEDELIKFANWIYAFYGEKK
jgi:hypothetical protein